MLELQAETIFAEASAWKAMVFALVRGCGGLYDWLVIAHVTARVIACHGAHAAHGRSRQSQLVTAAHAPHASHGRLGAHAAHAGHSHPRRSQLPTPVTAAPQPPRAHRRRRRCKKVFSERRGIRGGTVTSDRNYPLAAHRHLCRCVLHRLFAIPCRRRNLGGDHLPPAADPGPGLCVSRRRQPGAGANALDCLQHQRK